MARDDTNRSKDRAFSERRLVESARAGDLAAREEIVRQHQKMVYNLALRMTRNSDDAAVILQETFLKVFAYPNGGSRCDCA